MSSEIAHTLTAADGTELAYWVRPADEPGGRTLLLLHGAASNHTRWSEFVDHTSQTRTWNVVRPDLRGSGASMTRQGQNVETWCSDLVRILDHENVTAVTIIGHSLGAQIAMNFAHRFPERVVGLVLIDPVFQRALQGKQAFLSRNEWLLRGAASVIGVFNRLGFYRRHIPDRDLRQLDEETREALEGEESFEEIAKRYSALGLILAHMPTANYLRQALATVGPVSGLEEIDKPVLVLLSGGITFADAEINAEEISRFVDVEVVTLDANHWPLTEAPEQTRREIEQWLDQRFPPGSGSDPSRGRTPATL
jgi:pimeloyl-ACP methyl ester carboxylesterase